MSDDRLARQMQFILEIDKLKRILRQSLLTDVLRQENSSEHSWHVAMMAILLAEPFIGHFLWEYACHFPARESTFASITRRVPFHLGLTLLRIARNSWITGKYRRQLLDEARRTLR